MGRGRGTESSGLGPSPRSGPNSIITEDAHLLALASIKRISDLTLLRTDEEAMAVGPSRAIFQPAFGAKQDRPGHLPPPLVISAVGDELICPLRHLKEYWPGQTG